MISSDKDPEVLELLSADSRYLKNANIVEYNDLRMYDIPYLASIENDTNDEYVVITSRYKNRYDKLSFDKYSNSKYWWILCDINDINNPFQLEVNKIVRIPTVSKLFSEEVI